MNLRKFRDLNGEYLATIGNYSQDINTGKLLANQFLEVIEQPEEYPELTRNDELKKLIRRFPKDDENTFTGLIVGFFSVISIRLERVFETKPLTEKDIIDDRLIDYLREIQEYREQKRTRLHNIIEQWAINLSKAVNSAEYDGLERFELGRLALELPNAIYFSKDHYAGFCFALTLLLKKLLANDGGDNEYC